MGDLFGLAVRGRTLLAAALLLPAGLLCAAEVVTVHNPLNARARWEASAPSDYSFVLERNCYCAAPNHVRIQVRGGKVVQVEDLQSGRRLTDEAILAQYPTIDQLLALIDRAVQKKPDNLTITYDRHLGYPSRIYIDYSYRMADEEVDYHITEFDLP